MINEVKTAKPEDCLVAGQIAALMGKRSPSYPALAKILTPMGSCYTQRLAAKDIARLASYPTEFFSN
ncbi:MAG: hypothetical protein RMY36_019185 [Nostoc sp. SerVER01]|nr:hypothetical protein [Nostoc sp. SerVER01]MDZ8024632.1 hypothetical protein [Nostoc sp. DedQUE11]MDZ8071261.1 hypothetical protein [Nostoc sp. DedQUE01]MDZ8082403.1 hypothetical protein [Nostoc sp. DcaGUA01]